MHKGKTLNNMDSKTFDKKSLCLRCKYRNGCVACEVGYCKVCNKQIAYRAYDYCYDCAFLLQKCYMCDGSLEFDKNAGIEVFTQQLEEVKFYRSFMDAAYCNRKENECNEVITNIRNGKISSYQQLDEQLKKYMSDRR